MAFDMSNILDLSIGSHYLGLCDEIGILEQEVLKLPQLELPPTHEFCDNLYARTIILPKNSIIIGQIHAHDGFFIIRYGNCHVTTDSGVQHLFTGDMIVTKKGTKRALFMLEETMITTVHHNPTNTNDPEELWSFYVDSGAPQ